MQFTQEQAFSQEELKNIAILIQKSTITGAESTTVALLLQKIGSLLTPVETKPDEKGSKSK